MPKLYHRRPWNMRGHTLLPLNQLKSVDPDLYQQQRKKYDGRESLLQQRVPPLDCLWNDVLHLSPVHPAKIAELARAEGLGWVECDWFEIDPAAAGMTADNTSVFLYRIIDYGERMAIEEFEPFNVENVGRMTEIPQGTRDYYKSAAKEGRYLIFVGVPHVLHRGQLNIEAMPIVRA